MSARKALLLIVITLLFGARASAQYYKAPKMDDLSAYSENGQIRAMKAYEDELSKSISICRWATAGCALMTTACSSAALVCYLEYKEVEGADFWGYGQKDLEYCGKFIEGAVGCAVLTAVFGVVTKRFKQDIGENKVVLRTSAGGFVVEF